MRPSAPTQDANNRITYIVDIVDQVPLSSLVFQNLCYKKPPCQTLCIVRVHVHTDQASVDVTDLFYTPFY